MFLQSVIKLGEISICCTVRETSVVTLSIHDWLEGFLYQASFTKGCFKFLLFKPWWQLMGVWGSFTLIEKKNLSNKCTITGISWNGKICLCQEWLSFRCIVCSCSGGILNRFLVKYQRFLRSMSEQPNLSETRGRHVKYVASDCHMILWNCVLNLWFIMSNVWFYHRSGLNSGPNSPRIMSGQRQNRYRRNQGHRSSGVERLSVNSDNLPPPPK